jgi:4-amino-4-deoxy-L-arabinose transferase-like glycosyltransferase
VLPGVFGRDPWKNADITAFGQMLAMAEGRTSWLTPALGGVPTDASPLPNWLGAAFIMATSSWLDASVAVRIPFALLLALTLAALWYACFALARTEAAQPLPFAFGGEAQGIDYARAIADASILALVGTLGLLQRCRSWPAAVRRPWPRCSAWPVSRSARAPRTTACIASAGGWRRRPRWPA